MLCWFYKTAYLCNRKTETSTAKRGREPEGERTLSSAGSERLPYKQRVGGSNPSATTLIDLSFPTKEDFKLFEKFDIRQVVQFLGRASAKSFTVNEFRFDLMAKTVLR